MKKLFFASAFALVLAGCGGGSKQAQIAKLCKDDGDMSAAECDCMAKAAVDKLDGKMVDMLIKAAKSGDDDAAMQSMMSDMTSEQMGQFMAFGMEIATTCEGS
ncbi:MAG: hypothetical protein GYB42_05670 [Alphaproteobacteria bacterium]|jgi:CHASE3 domain sensor protein|nr:hypothetical protein [Alphaproteobacteria bacterium]